MSGEVDHWLTLLSLNEDDNSGLLSTVDRSCNSRTRSRSRSSKRFLGPTGASVRQLMEPKALAPSMADLEIEFFEKKILRLNVPTHSHFHEADPKDSISSLMRIWVSRFYIGATIDPIRRWLGGTSDGRESDMPGHCQEYHSMYLLAVSENKGGRPVARQLEAELIRFAQENWPEICANKAADARGQVDGLNFMYMVVKDDRF
jgi:hypothetical protein